MPDYIYGPSFGDISRQETDRRQLNRQSYFQSLQEQRERAALAQRAQETRINAMLQASEMARQARQAEIANAIDSQRNQNYLANAILEQTGQAQRAQEANRLKAAIAAEANRTRMGIAAQQAQAAKARADAAATERANRDRVSAERWTYDLGRDLLNVGVPVETIGKVLPDLQRFLPSLQSGREALAAQEQQANERNRAIADAINGMLAPMRQALQQIRDADNVQAAKIAEQAGLGMTTKPGAITALNQQINDLLDRAWRMQKAVEVDPASGTVKPVLSSMFSGTAPAPAQTEPTTPAPAAPTTAPTATAAPTTSTGDPRLDRAREMIAQYERMYAAQGVQVPRDVIIEMVAQRIAGAELGAERLGTNLNYAR